MDAKPRLLGASYQPIEPVAEVIRSKVSAFKHEFMQDMEVGLWYEKNNWNTAYLRANVAPKKLVVKRLMAWNVVDATVKTKPYQLYRPPKSYPFKGN